MHKRVAQWRAGDEDIDANAYDESEAYGISWLRWQVARLRGGVCEEDCRAGLPAFLRNRCHYDAMVVLPFSFSLLPLRARAPHAGAPAP